MFVPDYIKLEKGLPPIVRSDRIGSESPTSRPDFLAACFVTPTDTLYRLRVVNDSDIYHNWVAQVRDQSTGLPCRLRTSVDAMSA